jgi:hypothetical protein
MCANATRIGVTLIGARIPLFSNWRSQDEGRERSAQLSSHPVSSRAAHRLLPS